MYSFRNDYSELCHYQVLNALEKNNMNQFDGYGEDLITLEIKSKIKEIIKSDNVDIHFLSGGTQTNLVAISTILKPYQAVIAAESAHIATHECGAIEATGHKIITLETSNGKINSDQIRVIMEKHYSDEAREHITQPGMVYISNPTEYGTIYKKDELINIKKVCEEFEIPLYIDGARLAQGLMSDVSDILISDLPNLCDLFYIGGTKNGAMFGECLIIINDKFKKDFRYNLKQRGALLAKGFAIAIQFKALFENDLFFSLAKDANRKAKLINDEFQKLGIKMLVIQESNQIFPILENRIIKELRKNYLFYDWEKVDDNYTAIRVCISWATSDDIVKEFINNVKELTKM